MLPAISACVGAFYKPEVRSDRITVVLVDDKAIDDNHESWPPLPSGCPRAAPVAECDMSMQRNASFKTLWTGFEI
jgi:hypothetical protein